MIESTTPARGLLSILLLCFTVPLLSPLSYAQRGFRLDGYVGAGYHARGLFWGGENSVKHAQMLASLTLSGYIWDPRFMQFSLGGDFTGMRYSKESPGYDSDNVGYRVSTRFFEQRKLSFGLRYGRRRLSFEEAFVRPYSLKTHYLDKGFDVNVSRVKFLPTLRINYTERVYSSQREDPAEEFEKRVDIRADKTAGKTNFSLDYRFDGRKNQLFELDRTNQSLRVMERINFSPETRLWLDGSLFRYSTALPASPDIISDHGYFSMNFIKHLAEELQSNLFYSFSFTSGSGYEARSHGIRANFQYQPRPGLILTPELGAVTETRVTPEGSENITEPRAGLGANVQAELAGMRCTASLGLYYSQRRSDVYGPTSSLFWSGGAGAAMGRMESLQASLSYNYSNSDVEVSQSQSAENPLLIQVGRKSDSHRARLELRSRALRSLNAYYYADFRQFVNEYLLLGRAQSRVWNNGMTLGFRPVTLTVTYGQSFYDFADTRAEYVSYSGVLDARLVPGLELRMIARRRNRDDILFPDDFDLNHEVYLRYNIGKFGVSLIFQKIKGRFSGVRRLDEVFFVRISRSFNMRF
jgi:hypothetical protein